MDDQIFELGLVGAGFLGRPLAEHVDSHEKFSVTMVADPDDDARRTAGSQLGIPARNRYESATAMLQEKIVDGILLATPPDVRVSPISAALDQGVDVYCEKPLAVTTDTATRILDLVQNGSSDLRVGFQRRLHPGYERLRSHCKTSTPHRVTGEIGLDWVSGLEDTWKTDPEVSGSGFLLDTGIHLVDAAIWTTGIEPVRVMGTFQSHPVFDIDLFGHLRIEGRDGCVVSLDLDGAMPLPTERLQVNNKSSAFAVRREQWLSGEEMMGKFDSETIRTTIQGPKRGCTTVGRSGKTKADAIAQFLEGGSDLLASPSEAMMATAICECALESNMRDSPVELTIS